MATDVVTAFLRSRGEICLLRRSEAVGTHRGLWGGVSGYAEGDPDGQVEREIAEETGLLEAVEPVRSGRPLTVEDGERTWTVHPYLFDCTERTVTLSEEHDQYRWTSPTTILTGTFETVPGLWGAYERVGPTVRTVAGDTEHGAAYLSKRALEVLRDRAAVVERESSGSGREELAALAGDLVAARPAMAVLRNRVNRAMAEADPRNAAGVLAATQAGLERAHTVDEAAADALAEHVSGQVLTLSRSGTVRRGLERAGLDRVYVAESRPAREGVTVAETLVDAVPVTLHTDAAAATILAREPIDHVVVGADTILPDGSVVNKTGTRGLAAAADHAGVPVVVAAATDKVTHREAVNLESGPHEAVYGGEAPVDVANPTFEMTPPDLVDAVVTEDGPIEPAAVGTVAATHESLADWRAES